MLLQTTTAVIIYLAGTVVRPTRADTYLEYRIKYSKNNLTWSSAWATCVANNGHLIDLRDNVTGNVLKHLFALPETVALVGPIWTGLHNVATLPESTPVFKWADCNPNDTDTYWSNEPGSSYCVTADQTEALLTTATCETTTPFVCKEFDGSCTYAKQSDKICLVTNSHREALEGEFDDKKCQDRCTLDMRNSEFCWACERNTKTKICTLIFTSDPFVCENTADLKDFDLSIRNCFIFEDITGKNEQVVESTLPVSDCVTTPAPTSSPTSTTAASTSSTTTAVATTTSSAARTNSTTNIPETQSTTVPATTELINEPQTNPQITETSNATTSASVPNPYDTNTTITANNETTTVIAQTEAGLNTNSSLTYPSPTGPTSSQSESETTATESGSTPPTTSTQEGQSNPSTDNEVATATLSTQEEYSNPLSDHGQTSASSSTQEDSDSSTDSGRTVYMECVGVKFFTEEERQKRTDELVEDLTLDRKNLSSYKRTKASAEDKRTSAKNVGGAGIFLLILASVMIVVPDIMTVTMKVYKYKNKINTKKSEQKQSQ